MTGADFLEIGVSVLAIIALIVATWFAGALRTVSVTLESARERLNFDEPDFEPGDWLVGADGRAAISVASNLRGSALVFALGDGLVSRRAPPAKLSVSVAGANLVVGLNELSVAPIVIKAGNEAEAKNWLNKLSETG